MPMSRRSRLVITCAVLPWIFAHVSARAADDDKPSTAPPVKLGLSINDLKAFRGYTLFAPMTSTKTYLIDMEGKVIRTWESDCSPALSAYLLENGHLLRTGTLDQQSFGGGPGAGGRVQEFTWDGRLVWDFKFSSDKQLPHHDITRLPNGNVLMIVWDKKTAQEAIAAGRRTDLVGDGHWLPDCLIEVKPTGNTSGEVVWEWHVWDHLVQDHDKSRANYGKVADHPELVNINYGEDVLGPIAATKDGADKLKSIGYVGTTNSRRPPRLNPDWTHFNSVAYNPELDQVAVCVHAFSESWIIDHSTTTAEAASHRGGKGGKGGDILYRWGNPRAYGAGTKADQRLFAPHSAHGIPRGLPGEGHLLVFNNGGGRPDGSYSSVDELVLPVDAQGRYTRESGTAFGPDKPIWSYTAPKKSDLFSMLISGAQRLANGNTLICSGVNGTLLEVTPQKEVVWKYVNPTKPGPGLRGPGFGPPGAPGGSGGPGRFGGPPQPGQILPSFLQDMLNLTAEQKTQLDAFQKEVSGKLDQLLTDEQKRQLREPQRFGPGTFGGLPQPGQIMSPTLQARLKLTTEQKKQVEELQKETDGTLEKLLVDNQKKQLKEMRQGFGRGGPGGFGPPGGPGGFGPAGPGGPGGPGGFGPPGGSSLFRAYRYGTDYPGLVGKDLTPGKTVEELETKEPKPASGGR
jgi:hypothetical protein